MPEQRHPGVSRLQAFDQAGAAFDYASALYDAALDSIQARIETFRQGRRPATSAKPDAAACYPYVGIHVEVGEATERSRFAYGSLPGPGTYGTTITRPKLFRSYYLEQFELLLRNHQGPIVVGLSDRQIPLSFVIEPATLELDPQQLSELAAQFPLPDLSEIDDTVANGTYVPTAGRPRPLALFTAERVDYSLVRLRHYTGSTPEHFQRFVLFTNYQRYVDEFIAYAQEQIGSSKAYRNFIGPGDLTTSSTDAGDAAPEALTHLPQMPSYHLVRNRHEGITLINIGVGPSNAKTITDHLAVLRPHCWLMVGHCGGLRKTQRLGDYVLAHAYVRGDHVLDEDLPSWVPVPPIAEVQIALTDAVARETGLKGQELKSRLRTGTVYATDDRDWELRYNDLAQRFNQSRAIAVDMESATIAANGFRLRVPYGTLLCVSDKPLHGEIKLPATANTFYNESISQHLRIGISTIRNLRDRGVESLHSRKLRSFDEPAFR